MDINIPNRKLILSVSEHNSLRLDFDSASKFVIDGRVLENRELELLTDKNIVVTEVVVHYSNLGETPKSVILSMYIEFAEGLQIGDRVMVFDKLDWICDGSPEDKSDFWLPATILDIREPHHDIPQTVTVLWDHSKSISHSHRLENVRSFIEGDEARIKLPRIFKNVAITKFDLDGKENFYAGAKRFSLRHFVIANDDGTQTFIRLANADTPLTEEIERKILELQRFKVGDIVDVEVEPAKWRINDMSGISYWYQSIRRV